MNPERRQQIDQLFRNVLARPISERTAFLATECGDDNLLRVEVESLLASHHNESGTDEPLVTPPSNAYQAYQLARYHFNRISFADMMTSRAWLEEAVRLDPNFAPAHAALAEQWVMEAITGLHSPAESFPNAREGIRRASELNLQSAEFYTVAGFVDLICDWNFSGAEKHLRKAIELNPHEAFAYKYLGEVLMFQGRASEAEASLKRGAEIAPMNLHVGIILTISYFLARNYQKLAEESEKLLAISPRFVVADTYRCLAWEQMGRAAEAVVEYERILTEPDGKIARRFMGYAYALTGDREKALDTVEKLDAESRQHYLSPTYQAVIYAALNETDKAFSYLERGLAEHDPWMLWLGTDPRLDNLRSDARFQELLKAVGLTALVGAQPPARPRNKIAPECWQAVDRLFHDALEREPSQREKFLVDACQGDESLRSEIESLIAAHHDTEGFIESPPGDVAAEMLGSYEPGFEPGREISNYRIVRKLGAGGMGEVYLADDIRLKRKIALKILPPHFTVNPDRVRRFEREARAASALNHPNIVTIHEIGQSNSTHFIATEFVDGKTLRQLLDEKPFTLRETLNVGIQIAGALTGAHAAGIVHRDIKPENIMVRPDGYAKILDFGLAKLTEVQASDSDLETPTLLQSNPGLVMGTVQYMSPEQARGRKVDVRTDIWSLGIVLYELLAGRVPFTGETPSHVMVSLMEQELPPLSGYANVPAELNGIVSKALRKNPKERYQSAAQLATELKHLKRELQLDERLKGLLEAVPDKERTREDRVGEQASARGRVTATGTVALQPEVTRPSFSAEYFTGGIGRHKSLVLVSLFVFIIGAIGLTYRLTNRNKVSVAPTSGQSSKRGTTNDEAYRHYLQGRNLTNQRTSAAARSAIEKFQEAIRLDPNFAQPYAGMANAYHSLGNRGDARTENLKAHEAIRKALELDNNLADAYAVRGLVNLTYEYDFTAAERDVLTALKLEPDNDVTHWTHALVLAYTGRFAEALKAIETAQAIAPGTAMYEHFRGRILYHGRRYDEAIVQLKRAIELKQDFPAAWSWIIRAHEMKGDQAGAYDWFIRWHELQKNEHTEQYRQAYESAGWTGVRRKIVEFVKLRKDYLGMHDYELAGNLAQLGETAEAFSYLNKAVEKREWEVAMLNIDPYLDGLRGDPRFNELVKRANFK